MNEQDETGLYQQPREHRGPKPGVAGGRGLDVVVQVFEQLAVIRAKKPGQRTAKHPSRKASRARFSACSVRF